MTPLEIQGKQDPERQELYDDISVLVADGLMDWEIATKLGFSNKIINAIRRTVLHINNYGRKRECPGCGKKQSITLFKLKHSQLCIVCRRKAGDDKYQRANKNEKEAPDTMTVLCLRCDKSFESEIYFEDGGVIPHVKNHLCSHCSGIATAQERVSI